MSLSPAETARAILANEAPIKRAFLDYVRAVLGNAKAASVERHISQGRANEILISLGIDENALADLTEAIRNAYVNGGRLEVKSIPPLRNSEGVRLRLRFDVRNVRAEAWLRDHSATLVQEIIGEQRLAIREMVEQGMRLGRNPRQVALDIIGPIDPSTGRRTGGIVGLTSQQARYVSNAREQLIRGTPAELRAYLTRVRRDKRFDKTVEKAIREGKPLKAAQIEKIVGRYADRFLALRGETIARTEALASFSQAQAETYRQAIEMGTVQPQQVKKTWKTSADARVRDLHRSMSGQRVDLEVPFRSPTGALLMQPGDTSLGAGGEDTINCRCIAAYKIDFLSRVRG